MSKESRKLAKNKLDDSYELPNSLILLIILMVSLSVIFMMGVVSGNIVITPFDGDDTLIEVKEEFWKLPDVIDDTIYKETPNDK